MNFNIYFDELKSKLYLELFCARMNTAEQFALLKCYLTRFCRSCNQSLKSNNGPRCFGI